MLSLAQIAELDVGGGNACSPEEYQFLAALVQLLAPAAILEIGTSTGIGAIVMGVAAADAGPATRVTSIDLPLGRTMFGDGLTRNLARARTWRPDIDARIELLLGDSRAVIDRLASEGRRFDLVFIDGGHTAAVVRGDWHRALALGPRTIVLHDTVHLDAVAQFARELTATHAAATFTYPRRAFSSPDARTSSAAGPDGPGLTIVTNLGAVEQARERSERVSVASVHEVATELVSRGILQPSHVGLAFPGLVEQDQERLARQQLDLEVLFVACARGPDRERIQTTASAAAQSMHARLLQAGIPLRVTLIEGAAASDDPPLLFRTGSADEQWRTLVVSSGWQRPCGLGVAANAGLRRARAHWVLVASAGGEVPRDSVDRLAGMVPRPGVLYLLRTEPAGIDGTGTAALLDRDSWLRIGGLDETPGLSEDEILRRLQAQARQFGLGIEWRGTEPHAPSEVPAPTYWNRPDWGLRAAVEQSAADAPGVFWLRAPEEAGPLLSVVVIGATQTQPVVDAVASLLDEGREIDVTVVCPTPEMHAALQPWLASGRLRVVATEAGALGAALEEAVASASGRHLVVFPSAGRIDPLDRLLACLTDGATVATLSIGDAGTEVTVVSRAALRLLGGVDPLAAMPVDDLVSRAQRLAAPRSVPEVTWLPFDEVPGGRAFEPAIESAWLSLDPANPLPAIVAADLQRRSDRLAEQMRARLSGSLPASATRVFVWGLSSLTPLAIAALRTLGRDVIAVHAPDADGTQACAGVPVRAAHEIDWASGAWTVSVAATPGDTISLLRQAPPSRIVHLVEPACLRPASLPLATEPAAVARARDLRGRGDLDAAARVCEVALRAPYVGDVAPLVYELALIALARDRSAEAERLLRWLLRRWPEQRVLLHYNLGSLREQQGRWAAARHQFERALTLTAPSDTGQRAGCLFHLGEIAASTGAIDEARAHFTAALEVSPNHRAARACLASLPIRRTARPQTADCRPQTDD